jgi:Arc/MetJ-type ribon-helix-helix transcriptional regulator
VNINIYLHEKLLAQIDVLAHRGRLSRSALIRTALESWLQRETAPVWPGVVSDWSGDSEFPLFEALRAGESSTRPDDPFVDHQDR